MATLTDGQRNAIVANCKWFVTNQKYIGYEQERPFPLYTKNKVENFFIAKTVITGWDCSASTVEIFLLSGAKDPTGFGFGGFGNTESMLATLGHYTNPVDAHLGALVIFGVGEDLDHQHVCIVTERGKDPQVFSHGSDKSCIIKPLSEIQPGFTGKTVFLDVGNLG